jgi:DNA-binding Xre family transcriptional regulator
MRVQLHWKKRASAKGIQSDAERERALVQVEFFRAALDKVRGSKPSRRNTEFVARCEAVLRERESEISEYDDLKQGKLDLPKFKRIDEIAAFLPRIRIARGVSQTELARRLGVSKQVVNRYEDSGYRTVGLARMQEILDALGTKIDIEIAADSQT